MHTLTIETTGGASLLDGNLQWILKYHMAMAAHMTADYEEAQQVTVSAVQYCTPYDTNELRGALAADTFPFDCHCDVYV